MSNTVPQILEEIERTVDAALVKRGIAPSIACEAAEECAEHVHQHFGGAIVYIPKGLGYQVAPRNAEIRHRLAAGESRDAIRREFKLSDMQIRRIEAGDTPRRR
jgi:Mor family transcriptional regulator